MSLYSEYDNFHPIYTRIQCSKGGKTRARDPRDQWGRLLPKNGTLPPPVNHGVAGGKKRSETGKREHGRYIKD